MTYRVGALTVIHQIITKPARNPSDEEELDDEAKANLSHKEMLQVSLLSCMNDVEIIASFDKNS